MGLLRFSILNYPQKPYYEEMDKVVIVTKRFTFISLSEFNFSIFIHLKINRLSQYFWLTP